MPSGHRGVRIGHARTVRSGAVVVGREQGLEELHVVEVGGTDVGLTEPQGAVDPLLDRPVLGPGRGAEGDLFLVAMPLTKNAIEAPGARRVHDVYVANIHPCRGAAGRRPARVDALVLWAVAKLDDEVLLGRGAGHPVSRPLCHDPRPDRADRGRDRVRGDEVASTAIGRIGGIWRGTGPVRRTIDSHAGRAAVTLASDNRDRKSTRLNS